MTTVSGRLGGYFSKPLSRLATAYVETWDFERVDNKTKVARSFKLNAESMLLLVLLK